MARVKLSEFDTKRLLFPTQKVFPATTNTKTGEIKSFFGNIPLVAKVDQGVKKRGLQGLVAVNVNPVQAVSHLRKWSDLGFSRFLIEPALEYDNTDEKYLSFTQTRVGWKILYSPHGGVNIENNWDLVTTKIPPRLQDLCQKLLPELEKYYLTSLELNPVIIRSQHLLAVDAAAEIDSAALGLAELGGTGITPVQDKSQSQSEKEVSILNESTPASLKYKLINPQGRIWMLLSGGGASLVLADEVADLGMGEDLANYGEYSGAPTDDDVYAYTKIILKDLLNAKTNKPKAIIIAGGVANFTDVAKTFRGVIRALDEKKPALVKAKVKVFVRRGGPNEKLGLTIMSEFLGRSGLHGCVHGHAAELTKVVSEVKKYLSL